MSRPHGSCGGWFAERSRTGLHPTAGFQSARRVENPPQITNLPHGRNNRTLSRGILLLAILAIPLTAAEPDLILKDGRIWTGDPAQPWADAIAIHHNRLVAVGDNLQVAATAGPHTRVIELNGRLTIPGFDDGHVHLIRGALRSTRVDLSGACSLSEMQKRIREYAAGHPKETWISGGGWDYSCFANRALPTRGDLDAAVKDRPAYLTAADGHTAWVNSKALQLAGITKGTKFSGAGKIVEDAFGEPAGALSGAAMALVHRLVPEVPREEKLAAIEQALRMFSSLGVTSIEDVGGDDEAVALLDELERQHKLTARVAVYITVSPPGSAEAVDHVIELLQAHRTSLVRVAGVNLIMDGQIAAHSAAMLQPYADAAGTAGKLLWSPEAFNEMAALCDSGGVQVATHAIGDRAVRATLDGYEYAHRANESHDSRFRIEQAETVAPADVGRLARMGVIAVMIPVHAEQGAMENWGKELGPDVIKAAFPWHSLEQAGAHLVFGSDWPSGISADPVHSINAAVNDWIAGQRIGVEDALRAGTVNGAYATFDNRNRGRLRRGMVADVVVLSQDLFEIAPAQIAKTRVDMTIFDGQVVYTRQ